MSTCRDCQDTYGGNKAGHCTRCHRTFSTDKNFDAHLEIEKGPGVFKVIGCNDPLGLLDKAGEPRFKTRTNAHGTDVFVGAGTFVPPTEAKQS